MMWRLSVGNFMHFARYETRGLLASENMPCCIEKPPRCIRATACRQGPFGRLLVTRRCRFVCVALYSADFGLDMSLPLTARMNRCAAHHDSAGICANEPRCKRHKQAAKGKTNDHSRDDS